MSPKGATRIYSPRYFACDSAEKEIPRSTMRAKNLQIRHAIEIKLNVYRAVVRSGAACRHPASPGVG
jgi:hypothetical protein